VSLAEGDSPISNSSGSGSEYRRPQGSHTHLLMKLGGGGLSPLMGNPLAGEELSPPPNRALIIPLACEGDRNGSGDVSVTACGSLACQEKNSAEVQVGLALLHKGLVTSSLREYMQKSVNEFALLQRSFREKLALRVYTPKKCSLTRIQTLDGAHSILSERC